VNLDLPGRTVAITGAGGGLGRELATRLRAEGANVALLDLRLETVNALAEEFGGDRFARGWSVDVCDLNALEAAMDEVALGEPCRRRIDPEAMEQMNPERWSDQGEPYDSPECSRL
jgi:NAD(P)-dependent dehydrogenase (short-subunit alcohol dehydrogenase family)